MSRQLEYQACIQLYVEVWGGENVEAFKRECATYNTKKLQQTYELLEEQRGEIETLS